jgi:hypothetical protein
MEKLLSQAQSILSTTAPSWQILIDTIPKELLARSPAPGEWSALECLQHLLDTEQNVFPIRVRAFLAGQNFPGFNPAASGTRLTSDVIPAKLLASFTTARIANLKLLHGLTLNDLTRTALHGELGKVTLAEMLNEWIGHDLMHTVQAERAILQPFIAGSGPWRKYFADHDIAPAK